jgi:cytochrome c2
MATNVGIAADPQRGQTIVRQWCEACHLADSKISASDVGPPFAQIAKDPAYTDARLRGWLHDPHPPMPKFEMDRRMIDDIIAFIRTLKN